MIASLTHYTHALRRPIVTASGTLRERRGLILNLEGPDGHTGRGEAAPLPGYSTATLQAVGQALSTLLTGPPLPDAVWTEVDAIRTLSAASAWPSEARHALEQALLDQLSQRRGVALATLLGGDPDRQVPLHQLVRDADDAAVAVARGAGVLKLKVGAAALADDLARLQRVRERVGPGCTLRLDANQAWTGPDARRFLTAAAAFDVALCEEPLRDPTAHALAQLRATSPIALAADESARAVAALDALIAADAVDTVVLKPMLCGGPLSTLAMASRAAEAGLRVIITTSFETELGLRAAHAVAQAVDPGALDACGLDPVAATCGPAPAGPPPRWPSPLAAVAAARPADVAVATAERATLTWCQLRDAAAATASHLAAKGLRPGDVLAFEAPREISTIVALHAAGWLGATAMPLDPAASSAARAQLCAGARVTHVVTRDELVATPPGLSIAAHAWADGATRVLLATSGSTGTPRVVRLTTRQLYASALGSALRLGHHHDDRWLCCLPLHHVGGLSIPLRGALGGTATLVHPRFDPAAVASALDAGDATLIPLVPAMLRQLLDARPERPFPTTLRAVLVGGAALPDALRARCRALGVPLAETWGMTETASQVATTAPGDDGRLGLAPLVSASVGANAAGRLLVAGPLAPDGALLTADRGAMHQGRVTVTGRADDLIVSGGENISPRAIERALIAHPAIADAAVVSIPDAGWGARPAAALVAAVDHPRPSDADLRADLRANLRGYEIPRSYRWVDALPRTALGKVARAEVRALFATSSTAPCPLTVPHAARPEAGHGH